MKLPKETSFAWLCGFIGALHDCVNILAQGKQDVNAVAAFTIPTTGWGTDNSVPQYPYYLDVSVNGLAATDIVNVTIAPESAWAASAAEFYPCTQSYDGYFRLRCANVPETDLTAQYHITNTAEYSAE